MGTQTWFAGSIDTGMESGKCRLLGGWFSTLVQVVLGMLCIGALVVKRNTEVPRRDWDVWFLDVMKQAIGSGFGHFANIFLSVFIAGKIVDADECQWYCLTYTVDTTLGTIMNLLLLRCFDRYMERYPECTMLRFGDYGNPPQLCIWFPQLVVWMVIVMVAKALTMFLLFQFLYPLDVIISIIFEIFVEHPELELITVMIVVPTIMNTLQFWVTDTFLKRREEAEARDTELDEQLIAGLRPGSDDYAYRAGAPMRGAAARSALHRTSSGRDSNSMDSDGIQLSTVTVTANPSSKGVRYASLPSLSGHSDDDTLEAAFSLEEGVDDDYLRSRSLSTTAGAGHAGTPTEKNSGSGSGSGGGYLPTLLSGMGALFPAALAGGGAKFERVGSDEPLTGLVHTDAAVGTGGKAAGAGGWSGGRTAAEASPSLEEQPGGMGLGVGSAKGYYTPATAASATHSSIKQRSSGASAGAGQGRQQGGGRSRSRAGSGDSAEDREPCL